MKFTCPCCGYKTLSREAGGTYALCPVCFWEDDQIQFNDPDYEGGANKISLKQAQKNFLQFGACEIEVIGNVRKPLQDELKDESWKPVD